MSSLIHSSQLIKLATQIMDPISLITFKKKQFIFNKNIRCQKSNHIKILKNND